MRSRSFARDLTTNDTQAWLYNAPEADRPKDLGYYVGYRICQDFYERHHDKETAVRALMTLSDTRSVVMQSRYSHLVWN